MLSTAAFNALLKTLEEPPKNVIFILATTEVHKVLDTIKSRCQRFDFKRITTEDITKHLKYISEKEGINISDDALYYIAQNSAGGMRDSIALLDQLSVLNSEDSAISVEDINNLLGRLSFGSLTSLFDAVISSNQNQALEVLNGIYNEGNEPVQILYNFLDYLRNSLVLKSAPNTDDGSVVQLTGEQIKILKEKLNNLETHQIVSLIDKCANYIKELKASQTPKLWLDVAILDMSNLTENTKIADLQKRLSMIESGEGAKLVNSSPYNTPPQPVNKSVPPKPSEPKEQKPTPVENAVKTPEKAVSTEEEVLTAEVPMSKAPVKNSLNEMWQKFIDKVPSPSSAILKQQALPVKISQDEIIISIKSQIWLERFAKGGEKHAAVERAANALFGSSVKKILVRAPQAGDDEIRKEQNPEDEKPAPVPQPMPKEPEEIVPPEVVEEVIEQKEEMNSALNHTKTGDEFNHSDEVNMVMQLFEGKLIE